MKKAIFFIVFILLLSGTAFFFGYTTFRVGTDEYGIVVSRTSGIDSEILESGKFSWKWQALIPKNASIIKIQKTPALFRQHVSGSLPSAEIYSVQLDGRPDFSFDFEYEMYLSVKPDSLSDLVVSGAVSSTDDVSAYLERISKTIADDVTEYLCKNGLSDSDNIMAELDFENKYSSVNVSEFYVTSFKMPDLRLYELAVNSFDNFQILVDEELSRLAPLQAKKIIDDNRSVNKLVQLGEILKKYPELASLFAGNDPSSILKTLNEL